MQQHLEQTLLAYLQDLYPEWIDSREAAKTLNASAIKIRAACESLMRQGKTKGRSLAKGYIMQARTAAAAPPEAWEDSPLFKAHFERQKSGLYRITQDIRVTLHRPGAAAAAREISAGVLVRREAVTELLAALSKQAADGTAAETAAEQPQSSEAQPANQAADGIKPAPESKAKPSAARKPCKPFTPNPTRGYEVQRGKVKIFLDRRAASRVLTLSIEDLRELVRAVEKAQ